MSTYRTSLLTLCLACLLVMSAGAAEEGGNFLKQFPWTKGPAKADLKNMAEVQVPVGYMFTGAESTQRILERMGNPISGQELGFLAPTSLTWFVVFEFADVGYVKDDDKDKLDAAKMLKSIQTGTEYANKRRQKMGVPPLHVTGWEQPPRYNQETHNLEWAIRGECEGDPVVNYNTRLLGRKGVMEANLVVDPTKLSETLPAYQEILNGYTFKSGERYAEYRAGDKLAKYGLTALVAGGAAAVAVKTGLFATIAVFFKKAWKLVVVAVVAVGAFIKRLLFGASAPREQAE